MNIPNILTFIRFLMIPSFIYIFYSSMDNSILYATGIFFLAGITDVLDGYIARKYDLITKVGIVLDPLADKLMLITVLVCFTHQNFLPIWVILIVGVKEAFMILGGVFLFYSDENIVIPANRFGKVATFSFYVLIFAVAFDIDGTLTFLLVLLAVTLALIAFVNYFIAFKNIDRENNKTKCIDK